jgi:hypothetical protein
MLASFIKMCPENPVWLKSKRKIQTLEKISAFIIKSRSLLRRIRNVSIKCTLCSTKIKRPSPELEVT